MHNHQHADDFPHALFPQQLQSFIDTHGIRSESDEDEKGVLDLISVVIYLTERVKFEAGLDHAGATVSQLHANALLMLAVAEVQAHIIDMEVEDVGELALYAVLSEQFGDDTDDLIDSVIVDFNELSKIPYWTDRLIQVMVAVHAIIALDDVAQYQVLVQVLTNLHDFYTQGNPSRSLSS